MTNGWTIYIIFGIVLKLKKSVRNIKQKKLQNFIVSNKTYVI